MALEREDYVGHKSDSESYTADLVLNQAPVLIHKKHCSLQEAALDGGGLF